MCIGNLRSGTDLLVKYKRSGDRSQLFDGLKYYAINLFFVLGAVISVYVTKAFMEYSILFCLVPLILVFLLMFLKYGNGG